MPAPDRVRRQRKPRPLRGRRPAAGQRNLRLRRMWGLQWGRGARLGPRGLLGSNLSARTAGREPGVQRLRADLFGTDTQGPVDTIPGAERLREVEPAHACVRRVLGPGVSVRALQHFDAAIRRTGLAPRFGQALERVEVGMAGCQSPLLPTGARTRRASAVRRLPTRRSATRQRCQSSRPAESIARRSVRGSAAIRRSFRPPRGLRPAARPGLHLSEGRMLRIQTVGDDRHGCSPSPLRPAHSVGWRPPGTAVAAVRGRAAPHCPRGNLVAAPEIRATTIPRAWVPSASEATAQAGGSRPVDSLKRDVAALPR